MYRETTKDLQKKGTVFAMSICEQPIAVWDSGVGGISVLRELLAIMPEENYLYFGDSQNAPYGTKTREEVCRLSFQNIEYLRSLGAKAVVIACNTATGAAAKELREAYPSLPIIGIEPALKPAALEKENPTVIVMATPLTLHQEKFEELYRKYNQNAHIILLPCPGLVELIEAGKTEGAELEDYLHALLSPYCEAHPDSVVLGCTHYPHIKSAIAHVLGEEIAIFDGGAGTARETRRRLEAAGLRNPGVQKGRVTILNSSGREDMIELSRRLLYR